MGKSLVIVPTYVFAVLYFEAINIEQLKVQVQI